MQEKETIYIVDNDPKRMRDLFQELSEDVNNVIVFNDIIIWKHMICFWLMRHVWWMGIE